MPSTLHQALVWAFADDPSLAFDLAREVFGLELPQLCTITDRRAELDAFAPCFGDSKELRPDLALSAELAAPKSKAARKHRGGIGMIVEAQRDLIHAKRWRIWVYWALFAERLQRTTLVMLVTLDDDVARWARRLGSLELPEREGLLVLDRQNMPRVTTIKAARRRPSLALLSALQHARNDDIVVMSAALRAVLNLRDDRRWRYASAIISAAPDHRKAELQEHLTMEERYRLTELERNSIAFHDGRREGIREGKRKGKREGLREGLLEGERKGIREGKREGKLEGKREGLVQLVLTILELRCIHVDPGSRRRIRSCKSLERLEHWVSHAKQITSVAELFEPR
jgi:hypothetical protein